MTKNVNHVKGFKFHKGVFMNLNNIIKDLKITYTIGSTDLEISDIIYDSRKAVKNCVFVCLKGFGFDGHDFIEDAIKKGAIAIVGEKNLNIPGVTIIQVQNARAALAHMSVNFFNHPSKKLITIAVTGTKGKTTTSHMIKSILENSGEKAGLIGTLGMSIGQEYKSLNNTTPESYEIQKLLREMVNEGCKYAVMEASSIGLLRNRLDGINFDFGIFTNISHDHVGDGEHKNYQEYIESKSLLFKRCKFGIINRNDQNYLEVVKNHKCKLEFFGMDPSSNYYATNFKLLKAGETLGISFNIKGEVILDEVFISMPGRFNVYNALAAIAVCSKLGISEYSMLKGLKTLKVKGRVESIPTNKDFSVIIDYAHNALSMENLLNTLKEYNPKRIITVFGAGGNRPKIRRLEMGEVSGRLSDFSIITSDNPRFEEPLDIIEDIKKGISSTKGKYTVIPSRIDAISYAINNAQSGDVIVLAGKGHEEYQEIKGIKHPLSERKIAIDLLKSLKS